MSQLKLCPFCGGTPIFNDVEERDDRRYMVMELEVCARMSSSIGYGKFKTMTDKAIKEELTSRLIERWNKRVPPTSQEVSDYLTMLVEKHGQIDDLCKTEAFSAIEQAVLAKLGEQEPDCYAVLTPNGSKLVSPEEARGLLKAYPLYAAPPIPAGMALDAARHHKMREIWDGDSEIALDYLMNLDDSAAMDVVLDKLIAAAGVKP
jgi:hypothetical protein